MWQCLFEFPMKETYRIIIVGGGTAGWMAAAALSYLYKKPECSITLVESSEIGTIGVGEATLPQIKDFNDRLGISEAEMMARTQATFKLAIKFVDWGKLNNSYYHPFGIFGSHRNTLQFYKLWAKYNSETKIKELDEFSYAIQLCKNNKFNFHSQDKESISSTHSYAYHFDASLYANLLREYSEKRDVQRVEGKISQVIKNENNNITSLQLESGLTIEGDFFIDCSGLRSLLLAGSFGAEFEDWSKWLVCDRAVALPGEKIENIPPYTTSTAKEGGWQWKIPLQHRTGNGYVYSSSFISDQQAIDSLVETLDGTHIGDPRVIKFKSGRYKKSWVNNCVAIGLSSGFLEPLESTSIYLIQTAVIYLTRLFSFSKSFEVEAKEYNRLMDVEYERIRDFLILHYYQNERDDSELWRYCRNMSVPESLLDKISAFEKRGHVEVYKYGLFSFPSWVAVMHGQSIEQQSHDPFIAAIPNKEIEKSISELLTDISKGVSTASPHSEFIKRYCSSK